MKVNAGQVDDSRFLNILIVDDDKTFYEPLSFYLNEIGYQCDVAETFALGESMAIAGNYSIILLDIFLPDMNGLEGIRKMKSLPSSPEVIIITGQGNIEQAEVALTRGAWDYLEKPVRYDKIKVLVSRALEFHREKLKINEHKLLNRESIIGNSRQLMDCFEVVAKAANTSESVLISGETGTGKELMAHTVHLNSLRRDGSFVTVDCTNIPSNLMESLLFGHVKGSFTGADKNQEGLIQQANLGTLFFDEVGDLPLSLQKSLLGVLQRKEFRPLGAQKTIACNFRVISATNRDLKEMVEQGQFRKDLYYRLAAFPLHIPPLRERMEDLKFLVHHYVDLICEEKGINTKGISRDLIEGMKQYHWPGNIRELINTLHTTIANATCEPALYLQHLPLDLRVTLLKNTMKQEKKDDDVTRQIVLGINTARFPTLEEFRNASEARYLDELKLLAAEKSMKAWELAGISRSGWYNLVEKHRKRQQESKLKHLKTAGNQSSQGRIGDAPRA